MSDAALPIALQAQGLAAEAAAQLAGSPDLAGLTRPSALGWQGADFKPRLINGVWRSGLDPRRQVTSDVWNGVVYCVDVINGNDANSGLNFSVPKKSISNAIDTGNANGSATAYIILVRNSGVYSAASGGFASGKYPSKPCAIIAESGTILAHNSLDTSWSLYSGATYTTTQSQTGNVIDLVTGLELTYAGLFSTAVLADTALVTAGSGWALVGATVAAATAVYVLRPDAAAVTNTNTRALRWQNFACFPNINPSTLAPGKDVYIEGFELWGGLYGGLDFSNGAASGNTTAVTRNIAGSRIKTRFGGGPTSPCNGLSVDYTIGQAAFFDCDFGKSTTDGVNAHGRGSSSIDLLTENCVADDLGRFSSSIANGYSTHEAVRSIDLSGDYSNSIAPCFYNIDTSKCWIVGTKVGNAGTAVRAGGSAQIFADYIQAVGNTAALQANESGGRLYHRNSVIAGPIVQGNGGIVTTY